MPWNEIALHLGISEASARRIAEDALAKLRVELLRVGVDESVMLDWCAMQQRVGRTPDIVTTAVLAIARDSR